MASFFTKTTTVVALGVMVLAAQLGIAAKADTSSTPDSQAMSGHHNDSTLTSKTTSAESKAPKLAPQSTCPVMGGEINKSVYSDYKGKRVYFCCGGCTETFNKNPEKYIKKLGAMGQGVETIAADTKK